MRRKSICCGVLIDTKCMVGRCTASAILLKLAIPTVSRVAFLWNPDNPSHAAYLDEWKTAAPAQGAIEQWVAARRLRGLARLQGLGTTTTRTIKIEK